MKEQKDQIDKKQINTFFAIANKILKIFFFLIIILLIAVITYLLKIWKVFPFLLTILKIISPIFIGFILAWILDPLATKLQKKMPRGLACVLVYLLFLASLIGVVALLIPSFAAGISDIVETLPKTIDSIQEFLTNLLQGNSFLKNYQESMLTKIEAFGGDLAEGLPNTLIRIAKSLISGGTNVTLGIIIGFYLLFDFRKVQGNVLSLMPNTWHENAKDLMKRINGKLRNYVQGVLLVMLFVFVTQFIGLSLAGLKAPIVFAFFCAVTDVIPYIGPWIGGIPAVVVGFTMNPMTGLFSLLSIIVCQTLENNFYQPLIMGKTMKLHPVTIMLGLLIFSHFFGMIGMIVATPVIASLKIIIEFIEEKTGFSKKVQNYQKKEKKETRKKESTRKENDKES